MKKLLILGRYEYHEKTYLNLITDELNFRGVKWDRVKYPTDFFLYSLKTVLQHRRENVYEAVDWGAYTHFFFIDWWYVDMPFINLLLSKVPSFKEQNPVMTAFFLGSECMENDVAQKIPRAKPFETYLLSCYDQVIVPNKWVASLPVFSQNEGTSTVRVQQHPLSYYLQADRPHAPQEPTVINFHRFAKDKGKQLWVNFIMDAQKRYPNVNWRFIQLTEINDENDTKVLESLGVEMPGFLEGDELREICKGAYVFSAGKSETIGLGILNGLSKGATPLLMHHPCYKSLHDQKYIFDTIASAVDAAAACELQYSQTEYKQLRHSNKDNTKKIVDIILSERT